jgi:hypothetical protein
MPPNADKAWLASALGAVLFFWGYKSFRLLTTSYPFRFLVYSDIYPKIALAASLVMSFSFGYLVFLYSGMLPTIWKFYMAVGVAMSAYQVAFLLLMLPYDILQANRRRDVGN